MPVAASWKDILVLVDRIKRDRKRMVFCRATMELRLKTLEASFKDDGIEIIRNHIANSKKQMEDAIPSFDTVLKNMVAYAYWLKKAEDSIPQNERYFPGI